ncbi:hypothetical protein LNV08_19300 [Paucibacter sp. TC2R-5]|uniref:type IV pilus assembly protein FimV n=1 Tax=Paucibacter sp. TC2R-5 TaxID=2893555 RepID=UPI0021E3D147|nr:hypothetical protein [Paucibacter sp. TC2R-5]MCV2361124.1 hypothetical protein [Paucibacter sp. TC2R-5]
MPPTHLRGAAWRICSLSALALALMAQLGNAQALGLGRPQVLSVLGQPLVLSFPLSLRAGESLSMDCVSAEVMAGGAKLPANKVGVRLEGESETSLRAIRVLSSVPIEEPILSVTLSLGCPARLTRQFSALMDPPSAQDGASPEPHTSGESPRVLSPALRAALATTDAKPKELLGANLSDAIGQERLTAAKPAPAGGSKAQGKAGSKSSATESAAKSVVKQSDALPESAPPSAASRSQTTKAAPTAKTEKTSVASLTEPKLRLEAFDPNSAAANNSAAAASAAEAALARLQKVESGLLGLQSEYRGDALKLNAMRQGLEAGAAPTPANAFSPLTWVLGALALLLSLATAYLWRKQSQHQTGGDSNWWGHAPEVAESHAGSSSDSRPSGEAQNVELAQPLKAEQLNAETGAAAPPIAAPQEQTIALPHSVGAEYAPIPNTMPAELPDKELSSLARFSQLMAAEPNHEPLSVQFIDPSDSIAAAFGGVGAEGTAKTQAATDQHLVSVEELIDLEQQVDFFLVLGQDEAAVDLLHGQLRQGADGANHSALPYLKLMEICQQRGDALAFADIAGRYALEFNTSPPAWDVNLELGQGLEAYPAVISSLQSRWSDSGASMVALQKLLSSRDGRSASFDLPALRDLLLLYSVARDRSEHEVRGEEIDLFLPLETDFQAGHPTGFDLMATMVWQGKPGTGSDAGGSGGSSGAAPLARDVDIGVDILLDDVVSAHVPSSTAPSTGSGKF